MEEVYFVWTAVSVWLKVIIFSSKSLLNYYSHSTLQSQILPELQWCPRLQDKEETDFGGDVFWKIMETFRRNSTQHQKLRIKHDVTMRK